MAESIALVSAVTSALRSLTSLSTVAIAESIALVSAVTSALRSLTSLSITAISLSTVAMAESIVGFSSN